MAKENLSSERVVRMPDNTERDLNDVAASTVTYGVPKTADYTVTAADIARGTVFTNVGAAGTIVLQAPAAKSGMSWGGYRSANQIVRLKPATGETVGTGGTSKYLEIQSVKGYARLRCVVDGHWVVAESAGTIAYEP